METIDGETTQAGVDGVSVGLIVGTVPTTAGQGTDGGQLNGFFGHDWAVGPFLTNDKFGGKHRLLSRCAGCLH